MRRRQERLSLADVQAAATRYRSGQTLAKISRQLGLGVNPLPRTSTDWGVAPGEDAEMEKRTQRVRRSFTPEFKADVVRMHQVEGRSIPAIARDLDLTETAVRSWVRQAEIDAGTRDGLTNEERAELAHLRREVRVLREDRDLLKRATAFFAKETR